LDRDRDRDGDRLSVPFIGDLELDLEFCFRGDFDLGELFLGEREEDRGGLSGAGDVLEVLEAASFRGEGDRGELDRSRGEGERPLGEGERPLGEGERSLGEGERSLGE
jgi:hypothetical protein